MDKSDKSLRDSWLQRLESNLHCSLIQEEGKPTFLASPDRSVLVVLAAGYKLVKGKYYWIEFNTNHKRFLKDSKAKKRYVAFGCGSADTLLLIPAEQFLNWLKSNKLNYRKERKLWYVEIHPKAQNRFELHGKGGKPIDLTRYLS